MTRIVVSCRIACLAFLIALVNAGSLQAHPGHGTTRPDSPAHMLEPVHFVTLLAALCIVGLIAGLLVFKRRQPVKVQAERRDRGDGSHGSDG